MPGPNSRLGQEIQRILKEHPDGLTPDDLEIELCQPSPNSLCGEVAL